MYRSMSPRHLSPYDISESDLMIANLRRQIAQIEGIEGNFMPLNDRMAEIESKYSLLLNEKERCEKDYKTMTSAHRQQSISQAHLLNQLTQDFERLSGELRMTLKDNQSIKNCIDDKTAEMEAHQQTVELLAGKNELSISDNKTKSLGLKREKEQKVRLENDCEDYSGRLEELTENIQTFEREARKIETNITLFTNELYQVEYQQGRINVSLRDRLLDLKVIKQKLQDQEIYGQKQRLRLKEFADNKQNCIKAEQNIRDKLNKESARTQYLLNQLQTAELYINNKNSQITDQIYKNKLLQSRKHEALRKNDQINTEISRILREMTLLQRTQNDLQNSLTMSQYIDQQVKQLLHRRGEPIGQLMKNATNSLIETCEQIR